MGGFHPYQATKSALTASACAARTVSENAVSSSVFMVSLLQCRLKPAFVALEQRISPTTRVGDRNRIVRCSNCGICNWSGMIFHAPVIARSRRRRDNPEQRAGAARNWPFRQFPNSPYSVGCSIWIMFPQAPFVLSPSKDYLFFKQLRKEGRRFDKLSANGRGGVGVMLRQAQGKRDLARINCSMT